MSVGQNTVAGEQLRGYVERVERIRADKKSLGQDESAIMAEAKASGFVPGAIRYVVKARAMKPHDRQEAEALRDMYMHALGMADEPPLFRAAGLMAVDTSAREQVIEAFKKFAPQEGDVIVRMGNKPVRLWRDRDGEVKVEDWHEPKPAPAAPSYAPDRPAAPTREPAPDVDDAGAEALGREYARDNRPVIDNPFPYGDPRRARFDEGWRRETGGDGMGPDD